jgi:hypothetical protein
VLAGGFRTWPLSCSGRYVRLMDRICDDLEGETAALAPVVGSLMEGQWRARRLRRGGRCVSSTRSWQRRCTVDDQVDNGQVLVVREETDR